MCNGKVYGKFSVRKLCCYSLNYAGWYPKLVMSAFGWPVYQNCWFELVAVCLWKGNYSTTILHTLLCNAKYIKQMFSG